MELAPRLCKPVNNVQYGSVQVMSLSIHRFSTLFILNRIKRSLFQLTLGGRPTTPWTGRQSVAWHARSLFWCFIVFKLFSESDAIGICTFILNWLIECWKMNFCVCSFEFPDEEMDWIYWVCLFIILVLILFGSRDSKRILRKNCWLHVHHWWIGHSVI